MSQHPPVHYPKNPILGFHGCDETVPHESVYLVNRFFFLLLLFFLARYFSLVQFFFFWQQFYYQFFVFPTPDPKFFFGSGKIKYS